MVIGALVRTEERGLGVQSRKFVKHIGASPLVISIPNASENVCPEDLSLYPDAPVARVAPGWQLDPRVVRPWLETIDVLWSAETFYSEDVTRWCRELGVRSVVHANPEFVSDRYGIGSPDLWWSATSWRLSSMPAGTRVVPWPCEPARQVAPHDGPARFVHVEGRRALADRNGTLTVIAAVRHLREPCSLRIVTQEPDLPSRIRVPSHVDVQVVTGGVARPADLYRDVDVLVSPRRYGGLHLPAGEAMARGMAAVMSACPPNMDAWPVVPVECYPGPMVPCAAGLVESWDVPPEALAAAMDSLADPVVRRVAQERARVWAVENSWDVWRDRYRELLGTSPADVRASRTMGP